MRGRPVGTCWAGPPDRRQRHLLLETEPGGTTIAIPDSSLVTIETYPDEGEDPPDIDAAMIRLGRHVVDSGDLGVRFGWVDVDEHFGIEVGVRVIPHICEPGPDPRATPHT